MAELNEQQLVLLNSLIYLDADYAPPASVGSIVDELRQEGALDNMDIGGGMTKADALEMLNEIAEDETLCALKVDSSVDTEIRGVCFVNSDNEAVIAFRGTGPAYAAWDDNTQGGYLSDTDMQQEALEFAQNCAQRYDDITVTGHSKGGNMAQYVTVLMGEEVDRCVSFDGQGFGDEFLLKYSDEIAANRHKIRSVNAYNDYVNILLTPIAGETVYLKNDSKDFIKGGHYIYDLYRTPGNNLDKNGEYIQSAKQAGYIKKVNELADKLAAAADLIGIEGPFVEFLLYSFIGMIMGKLCSGEDVDWNKIIEEFLENLDDYIEAGRNGNYGNKSVNYSISVNTQALLSYGSVMSGAAGDIEALRARIRKVQRQLATNIISGASVGLPLQAVLVQLDKEASKLKKLSAVLNSAAEQYDAAEKAAKGTAT